MVHLRARNCALGLLPGQGALLLEVDGVILEGLHNFLLLCLLVLDVLLPVLLCLLHFALVLCLLAQNPLLVGREVVVEERELLLRLLLELGVLPDCVLADVVHVVDSGVQLLQEIHAGLLVLLALQGHILYLGLLFLDALRQALDLPLPLLPALHSLLLVLSQVHLLASEMLPGFHHVPLALLVVLPFRDLELVLLQGKVLLCLLLQDLGLAKVREGFPLTGAPPRALLV